MRGRKRIISFVAVLSVLLVFSGVFASGVVDVSKLSLLGQVEPLSPGTEVSVYPRWVVKDYTLLPVNSKFVVHINVSSVTDLFTWQLNITWNKDILNASRIITGNNSTYILYNTGSVDKTASFKLGFVINATNNAKGYTGAADSILDNRVGAPGVSTVGWLRMVSIEFKVVGYGRCNLVISSTGTLATTLLNSARGSIGFTKIDGYFDNRIPGDVTGPAGEGIYDRKVDIYDLGYVGKFFGTSNSIADFTGPAGAPDGTVNIYDLGAVGKNFGRSV